jgi:hypothetical protein
VRQKYFVTNLQGFGFEELPEAAELYKNHPVVKKHSIWYHPPSTRKVIHKIVKLTLGHKQREHYTAIVKDMETEVRGVRQEYSYAMEKMMRLHQICGGHLPFFDDKRKPCLGELFTAKLSWLLLFLNLHDEKVVIWCMYRHEVLRIQKYLKSWNMSCGVYMGGKNKANEIANHTVVAATLDMGVSTNIFSQFPIAIYYSENYKFFLRSQSRYRTDRADSKHDTVTYYYLQCRDTIDEYIYASIRQRSMTARKLFNPKKFLNATSKTNPPTLDDQN